MINPKEHLLFSTKLRLSWRPTRKLATRKLFSTVTDAASKLLLTLTVQERHLTALVVVLKAKFHYAIWFEAGSKLVADRFEACRRPASNQLRTS